MSGTGEWIRERSSWILREEIRANARELTALLDTGRAAAQISAENARLREAARDEVRRAMEVIDYAEHRRSAAASHVTSAQVHVNAAWSLWLKTLSPAEIEPYLPGLFAVVAQHLVPADARRVAVEGIARDLRAAQSRDRPFEPSAGQMLAVVKAVDAARAAALAEKLRADSFVRIVRWMAAALSALAVAVAVLAAFWKGAVPLCFTSAAGPAVPGLPGGGEGTGVVCPTGAARPDAAREIGDVAGRGDYAVVEIVGVTAAGIAAASALRKVRGTSTAFGIPVALAVLKLPMGALTAVLGLLLMRGSFVPGLSALDSSAQIIAWAVVLGYSQELFTKFVDRQGQAVLDGVRGPAEPQVPRGGAGGAAAAK
ncbi:hypothetical protein [Actinomadura roseirufa]|uniref:hypothetical protein n=1 Tax=Actinomadura roseirufa TaxID=2094049 RepID=UPI0013F14B07|nr:hypothetical protein [Actinomadura roseirufa]